MEENSIDYRYWKARAKKYKMYLAITTMAWIVQFAAWVLLYIKCS